MQIFVVLLTDIREPARADAGKRHEGFLLPRHSLRQTRWLRGARGFVTSFSALGVRFHSHFLPALIGSDQCTTASSQKQRPTLIGPAPVRLGRDRADIDKSLRTAENRRGRWKSVGPDRIGRSADARVGHSQSPRKWPGDISTQGSQIFLWTRVHSIQNILLRTKLR